MNDLTKRLLSGAIYVTLFLGCVLFSSESYTVLIATFSSIAVFEFTKIINTKKSVNYLILIACFLYVNFFAENQRQVFFVVLTVIVNTIFIYNLFNNKNNRQIILLSKTITTLHYVILPFTILSILPFVKGTYRPELIIFIIVSIWVNDSFAYITGKNFGKTKLFERVSPKKTVEGFIGGLFFTIITGAIFGYYLETISIIDGLFISLIISIFGSIGDLVESQFKRSANVKDSGTIMPGHGGILDRLDSLFFLTPFVYLYLNFLT